MKNKLLTLTIISFLAFDFFGQQFNQITNINQTPNTFYYLNDFTALNDKLIFTHSKLGNYYPPKGLYISDGTIGGTFQFFNWPQNLLLLKNDLGTGYYDDNSFVTMSNNLYFKVKDQGQNPNFYKLFKTDGTGSGTSIIKDFGTKNFWSNMVVLNGQLYFMTKYFDSVWGNVTHELWKSDGTLNGTVVVKDWVNTTSFSNEIHIVAYNNKIYFEGYESDGSSFGTIQSGVNMPNENESCLYNGLLYYQGTDGKIWKTNGTVAGTSLAVDFPMTGKLFVFNGLMYFAGGYSGAGQTGIELCRTDGTLANTNIVKDIYVGFNSSSPSKFILFNGALYFWASDGIHGYELWKSDGTSSGTFLVKDIAVGTYGIVSRYQVIHNNELYFNLHDLSNTIYPGIWKTDGTEINTIQVKPVDSTGVMIDINCKLFVSFDTMRFDQFGNYMDNSELWSLVGNCQSSDIPEINNADNLVIYPNPTSHSIIIKGKEGMNQNFKIFDQMGREVISGKLNGMSADVNLSTLSKGMYTLKIEGNYQPAQIVKE
jgi:ELWxxDGT repeat protein